MAPHGSIAGDIVDNAALVFNRTGTLTYGGVISGTGSVTKIGTGTLTLTGDNTYTGGTTISAGTLQLGNGGTTGSVAGNIVDNGALTFNRSDAVTYARRDQRHRLAHPGRGRHHDPHRRQHLHGHYDDQRRDAAGRQWRHHGHHRTGNIVDNAALTFNRSDTLTYGGVISGTGSLTQAGTGTTILTGANTYTGGYDDQRRDAADRQWRHHGQRRRQHRRQRCAGDQPQRHADPWRRDQRHRLAHPGRNRNHDPHRRQHLYRRHDDQRRDAADRQWRHHRQHRRQHRQQRCAHIQPHRHADL